MDPRTASTVTAPDLLKAFSEGRGVDATAETERSLEVFMVLLVNGRAVHIAEMHLADVDSLLAEAGIHLRKGPEHSVLMHTSDAERGRLDEWRAQISADKS